MDASTKFIILYVVVMGGLMITAFVLSWNTESSTPSRRGKPKSLFDEEKSSNDPVV